VIGQSVGATLVFLLLDLLSFLLYLVLVTLATFRRARGRDARWPSRPQEGTSG
jgi:hypothetical protein